MFARWRLVLPQDQLQQIAPLAVAPDLLDAGVPEGSSRVICALAQIAVDEVELGFAQDNEVLLLFDVHHGDIVRHVIDQHAERIDDGVGDLFGHDVM